MVESDSECMQQLGTLKTNYENAYRNITEGTRQIFDLKGKLSTCEQHVDYLAKSIDQSKLSQEQRFTDLQKDIIAARSQNDQVQQELANAASRVEELVKTVTQKDQRITQLEHQEIE